MNMPINRFKRAITSGQLQLGLWSGLSNNVTVEVLANSGFDWLLLDTEHSPNELPMVHSQLQAMSHGKATPIVRPPWNGMVTIKRYLGTKPWQGASSRPAAPLSQWAATSASSRAAPKTSPQNPGQWPEGRSNQESNMSKVGFIGLGIMGTPMATNILKGGHELFVHARKAVPPALAEMGAAACASGEEVAQRADVIIMVPDTPDVASVLFDEHGVAAGRSAGKTVVDMSSISPIDTKRFAASINELDCAYLDEPVSGGEVGAKAASLTIMVGGLQRGQAAV